MKRISTLFALIAFVFLGSQVKAQSPMYVVSPYNDSIWSVDTSTYTTSLPGVVLTLAGNTITGSNGLAVNPSSGEFYTIVKASGVTGRLLCTVDPTTGVLTSIGNTGDNIAGIAFVDGNTLVGQSGDGGNTPESMYFIDLNTAALTLIGTNTDGSDGESIAYCTDNGHVYRWSGRDTSPAMQKWDPNTGNVTTVTRSGYNYDEVMGATYIGGGQFLLANLDQEFVIVDTAGFAVNTGAGTNAFGYGKGLAFQGRSIYFTDVDDGNIICPVGDSTQVVAFSPFNPTSYQWYYNGSPISGAVNDTIWSMGFGDYACEITDDECVTPCLTGPITLVAFQTDTAHVTPDAPIICIGDSVQLDGVASDSSQWWFSGALVTTDTFTVANAPGTYVYRLFSGPGCYDENQVVVMHDSIDVTINASDLLCNGDDSTGVAMTNTVNSFGPLTYMWNTGETGMNEMSLAAGTAIVTVTDSLGCVSVDSVTITEPADIVLTATSTDEMMGGDGTIDLTVTGGTPGFSYVWTPSGSGEDPSGLTAGTYMVTVTDVNGCSDTLSITVGSQVGIDEFGLDAVMSIYPNPNTGQFFMSFENVDLDNLTYEIYSASGQLVLREAVTSNPIDVDLTEFGSGLYNIRITDGTRQANRQIIVK